MARKKYVVELTAEERDTLEQLQQKGTSSARKLTRARILLKADEGLEDEAIAEAVGTSVATIERTRQRFVESNLEALNECPRPGGQPKPAIPGREGASGRATERKGRSGS
jgi:DNA-directed RNA polymerase specialized sigma24 family protein